MVHPTQFLFSALETPLLNAILSGKKRGSGLEGESVQDTFSGAEDTLTATVFERLAYLPDADLIDVLLSPRIWGSGNAARPAEVMSVSFWPRWPAVNGNSYVEPDCVLELADRVVLVEAKRHDFADMQVPAQLANEWASASLVFQDKPIWLLAVGGLRDGRGQTAIQKRNGVLTELQKLKASYTFDELEFAAISWSALYGAIASHIGELPKYSRLLDDIREGMLLHGVGVDPPSWLTDLVGAQSEWTPNRSIKAAPDIFFPDRPKSSLSNYGSISTPPGFFQRIAE